MQERTAGPRDVIFTNKHGQQVGGTMNAALSGQAEGKPYALYYTPPEEPNVSQFLGDFRTSKEAGEALWAHRKQWLASRKASMTKLNDGFSRGPSAGRRIARQHKASPQTDKTASVRAALHTNTPSSLFKLASAPRELADKHVEIKLTYNAAYGRPDRKDVQAFVAGEFPSTEIVDTISHNPGLMTLVLRAQKFIDPAIPAVPREEMKPCYCDEDDTSIDCQCCGAKKGEPCKHSQNQPEPARQAQIHRGGFPNTIGEWELVDFADDGSWARYDDLAGDLELKITHTGQMYDATVSSTQIIQHDQPEARVASAPTIAELAEMIEQLGPPSRTAQMDPGNLPAGTAAHPLPGGDKRGPAVGEEIEGTGVIGSKGASLEDTGLEIEHPLAHIKGAWLCGGAVRDVLRGHPHKDMDYFFANEAAFDEAKNYLLSKGAAHIEGGRLSSLRLQLNDENFELVAIKFGDLADILDGFDFTACQIAADGEKVVAMPNALQDVQSGTLRLATIINPTSSLARAEKFMKEKGFSDPLGVRTALQKTAQAAPPPPDPVNMAQEQGALPPQDGSVPPPEGSQDLAPPDDGMSLEQALQQLTEAAESVKQKVEQGDAILHGQEVTPAEDAPQSSLPPVAPEPAGAAPVQAAKKEGQIPPPWMIEELEKERKKREQQRRPRPQLPMPQPPPAAREAVDGSAKEYYHNYYGEYGDKMTREVPNAVADRMAMILIEAEAAKVALTDDQVLSIVATLQSRPEVHGAFERYAQMGMEPSMDQMVAMAMELSQSDRSVAKILDKMTIQYLIKTSDALNRMTPQEQQVILERAVRSNPHLYKKLLRLYNKHLGVQSDQPVSPAQPQIMQAAMKITAAGMKTPKPKGQPSDEVDVIKLEDVATDENVMPPAHIAMTYSDPVVKGIYTYMTVSWDTEDVHVSGQSLVLAIRRYVVNMASHKEPIDWGLIGPVHIDDVDPQAGVATVHFRTMKPGNAPVQVTSKE